MKRGREDDEFDFGRKGTHAFQIYTLLYQGRYNDAIEYAKRIKDIDYTVLVLCENDYDFSRRFMKEIERYWRGRYYSSYYSRVNDFRVADNLIKYFGIDFIRNNPYCIIRDELMTRFIRFECTVNHYNALPPRLRDDIVAFLLVLRRFRVPKDLRGRLVRMQVLQCFTCNIDVGQLVADTGLKVESQSLAQQLRFAFLTRNYKFICGFLNLSFDKNRHDSLIRILTDARNLRVVELYLHIDDEQLMSSTDVFLKELMPSELFERFIARKPRIYVSQIVLNHEQLQRMLYHNLVIYKRTLIPGVMTEFYNKLRLGVELGITITLDNTYNVFKPFGDVGKRIYKMLCLRYWLSYNRKFPGPVPSSYKDKIRWAKENKIPICLPRPKRESLDELDRAIKDTYYLKQMMLFAE